MTTTRHIAVIGSGYWGKNLVRNFDQLGALAYICDANQEALNAQAAKYPNAKPTTSFDQVLADDSIKGVVIATPAVMHHAHAKQALQAGKDVMIEKPLALHFHEGQELVEIARDAGRILMVGHILEYHPAVRLLNDLVHRGELGKILYIYSNRLNLGKIRQEENILWSFAPHDISVICSLLDAEPTTVCSSGGSYLQEGIVDVTTTNMTFASGTRAHIFVSWLHPSKEQKLVVIGDKKMAVFDDQAREGKLKIYDKGIEWRAGLPVPRQTAESTLFFDEVEPLRIECEHFLARIDDRQQPITNGPSALRVLKVLQSSQMSLERDGVPVKLAELESQANP